MTEIRYEEATKEVKEYLVAVENCRKSTCIVTKAVENVVGLIMSTARTYERLIHFPGASQEVVSYYVDSLSRLQSFNHEEMESFRVVWANNVLRQLEDLEFGARSAHAAGKRRRETREKFLKTLQKPNNPFASAVLPEKVKQKKDDYLLSSEQFDESYKALNGLRQQVVGVLQAHYFHDHSVMLRKLSEALKLRSTPPPPPETLHARDGFNAHGLISPATVTGGGSTATGGHFSADPSDRHAPLRRSEAEDEDAFEDVGSQTSSIADDDHHQYREDEDGEAADESDNEEGMMGTTSASNMGNSSSTMNTTARSVRERATPLVASNSRLPRMEMTTPVKPRPAEGNRGGDQRRLSSSGNASAPVLTSNEAAGRVYPEATMGSPLVFTDAVAGIPVLDQPSPFRQYHYHSRPGGAGVGGRPRSLPGTPQHQQQMAQASRRHSMPPLTAASRGWDDGEEESAASPPDVPSTQQQRDHAVGLTGSAAANSGRAQTSRPVMQGKPEKPLAARGGALRSTNRPTGAPQTPEPTDGPTPIQQQQQQFGGRALKNLPGLRRGSRTADSSGGDGTGKGSSGDFSRKSNPTLNGGTGSSIGTGANGATSNGSAGERPASGAAAATRAGTGRHPPERQSHGHMRPQPVLGSDGGSTGGGGDGANGDRCGNSEVRRGPGAGNSATSRDTAAATGSASTRSLDGPMYSALDIYGSAANRGPNSGGATSGIGASARQPSPGPAATLGMAGSGYYGDSMLGIDTFDTGLRRSTQGASSAACRSRYPSLYHDGSASGRGATGGGYSSAASSALANSRSRPSAMDSILGNMDDAYQLDFL